MCVTVDFSQGCRDNEEISVHLSQNSRDKRMC